MQHKGIIMAAGLGTRLWPLTQAVSKQMLPVFDKPMIYYPLSLMMEAGVRDIAIIVTPHDEPTFKRLLGDGAQWGVHLTYVLQDAPDGIGQAPVLAADFLENSPFVLALGDNLFDGPDVVSTLKTALHNNKGAMLLSSTVRDPSRFGVVTYAEDGRVTKLQEKPSFPTSNQAITGLYVFDERACGWANWLQPSERGEIEITDLLKIYMEHGDLRAVQLNEATTWMDTGTHSALLEAANYVEMMQIRSVELIGSPDVTALKNKWIDHSRFLRTAAEHNKTEYGTAMRQYVKPFETLRYATY